MLRAHTKITGGDDHGDAAADAGGDGGCDNDDEKSA